MRKLLLVAAPFILSACSALDSSSNFDDVVDSVNQRYNFVQVKSKSYTPATQAIKGPDVVQASVAIVANYPRLEQKAPETFVYVEVTTFESYDEYASVLFNGQTQKLRVDQPSKSMCSEHCVVTQYISFPISNDDLATSADLQFELRSGASRVVTGFTIASGYVNAVQREAKLQGSLNQVAPQASVQVATPAPVAVAAPVSKPEEMVQYWFNEGSDAERKQFADWAFSNRAEVKQAMNSESKALDMMAYWYEKADKTQKAGILSWLISQE
ncbi:DUF2057 family protein [Vibrio furnissii]|uniref:DUF2057 family protein n=1 Tax=Vibrio furnissii TaxID=29494 RepID=UPI001EEA83DC|nr:DUF2057 family protein [Vibrio furnissii]MCG6233396.1 DUF2057 domain-containing protein [Vibrio furnissii]MCG6258478.1 DUF2057 domain-containing protein [Vibrio furnissii]